MFKLGGYVLCEQERNLHKKASGYCALSCINAKEAVDRVIDMAGLAGMGTHMDIGGMTSERVHTA